MFNIDITNFYNGMGFCRVRLYNAGKELLKLELYTSSTILKLISCFDYIRTQ